ncbi:2-succinylbenzoyl-CoA synthetase [Thermosporothrix hazakensis]|uniref:2-succinylbenzoate--CoA ligase n=2 Tax=Thermosporothrix hazakensis TaxID=644383 RepID=A0A326UF29_THEHA|nr:2-succinylbenzoyl-CoA synthetase [Thermosporothrix hazakensis]GCE47135.1 2-succinylbenzoate--CoA ligase [Thermosporothrix hazakensis]
MKVETPSMTTTTVLPNWLKRCAENYPTRCALTYGSVHWSFAELNAQVERLARQLAGAGVQEGSRVACMAMNGPALVICVYALTRLKAILVPLNIRLSVQELCWQLQDVRADLLLYEPRFATTVATIAEMVPGLKQHALLTGSEDERYAVWLEAATEQDVPLSEEISLNATQAIMYTSGTTGHPKGVLITYAMQWWNAVGSALNMGLHARDCWLACMPLFHIGGLSILMRSVIYGIRIYVMEKFDAQAVNRAICEDGVTIISVVAVMLQRMLNALDEGQRYPETFRCALLGGGPAPLPLLQACAARNVPVVQTYGLTEACSQAATLAPEDALRKLGSAGKPLLPVQLRILNDGVEAKPGEPGTIYLKGPTITPGYDHRPDATSEAFFDGWFSTGDIGYVDAEGYLYVLDRRTDLIVSGGENVYPAEVEAALLSHPAVAEVGVCGREHVQWGQVPVACVCLHPGAQLSESELQRYAEQRLARYKVPKAIYFVSQLPRTASGKLVRRDLKLLLPEA